MPTSVRSQVILSVISEKGISCGVSVVDIFRFCFSFMTMVFDFGLVHGLAEHPDRSVASVIGSKTCNRH